MIHRRNRLKKGSALRSKLIDDFKEYDEADHSDKITNKKNENSLRRALKQAIAKENTARKPIDTHKLIPNHLLKG